MDNRATPPTIATATAATTAADGRVGDDEGAPRLRDEGTAQMLAGDLKGAQASQGPGC